MKCDVCGSEMKLLFTSWYCPKEDKHGEDVGYLRRSGWIYAYKKGNLEVTVSWRDSYWCVELLVIYPGLAAMNASKGVWSFDDIPGAVEELIAEEKEMDPGHLKGVPDKYEIVG